MHQQKPTAAEHPPCFVKETSRVGNVVNHVALEDEVKGVVGEGKMKCVDPANVQEFVPAYVGKQQFLTPNKLAAEASSAAYVYPDGIKADVLIHPFEATA
jgi:hypothetical protein